MMMKRYLKDKKGQGMSEYLILTFLIAIGAIGITQKLHTSIENKMEDVKDHIEKMNFNEKGGEGSGQGRGGGR